MAAVTVGVVWAGAVAKTGSIGAGAIQQADQLVRCTAHAVPARSLVRVGRRSRIKAGVEGRDYDALASAADAVRHRGAVPDLVRSDKKWGSISIRQIFPLALNRRDTRQISEGLRLLESQAGRDTTVRNQKVVGHFR